MVDSASSSTGPGVIPNALESALTSIRTSLALPSTSLNLLVQRFIGLMDDGLAQKGLDMAMIPAFVTGVPDGSEIGTYLALDLGGTNLRVCEVKLKGNGTFDITQEKYKVSDALKQGPVGDLMEYIAKSVDVFLSDYGSSSEEDVLNMGFTFSFPVEQTAIDKGTLIKWTKGFNCPDAPGKDVVESLQTELDKKHIKVKVNALVNDTVGALLAHSYQAGGAFIGAIYGTGTNGAYVANVEEVKKLHFGERGPGAHGNRPKKMLINTEWGGFDDDAQSRPSGTGLTITQWDNYVDRTSIRPRHHAFEKMISGMYLGEVVRAILISLIDRLLLFGGWSSEAMNTQYGFDTALISAIQADKSSASARSSSSVTRKVLVETMGVRDEHVSEVDIQTVRTVVDLVALRAARLSAVPIAATIQHTGQADEVGPGGQIKVGVDGSVVEYLPGFQDRMREALVEMLGDKVGEKVVFGLAKDGSGVGAALCALQAVKQEKEGHVVIAK